MRSCDNSVACLKHYCIPGNVSNTVCLFIYLKYRVQYVSIPFQMQPDCFQFILLVLSLTERGHEGEMS